MQPAVQFSPQHLDHSMQGVDFTTPQISQTNVAHVAHDPALHNPQILNYPTSLAQPTQYQTQNMPVNVHIHSSTYVTSAPPVVAPPYLVPVQLMYSPAATGWTTGLFDCFDDPLNALATVCFPCLTFGQVAEVLDNGTTSCGTSGLLYGCIAFLIGFPCFLSCTYRTKLRSRYNIVESPCSDCMVHFLCEYCALCQEFRELQNRGLDPSIGWQGNAMRNQAVQQNQFAMVPPTHQAMTG